MANTYTLLETITVGAAGASSVTFNSIPQTGYTDLVVKVSARSANASNFDNPRLTINSSTSTFTRREIYAESGTVGSESVADRIIGVVPAANATASTFGSLDFYLPNYTSSNYKSYSVDSVTENNSTTQASWLLAGLWSTTTAISNIAISLQSGGNFTQYSTFSLYGVSALGVTPTKAPKATGGSIIQTDGTYWYHAFLSSGTFTPATALSCDVLVVAGGGGGGTGGGGAGGYRSATGLAIAASANTVTVGAGGVGITSGNNSTNGNDSTFSTITSTGGGKGNITAVPSAGGSGGGGTPDAYIADNTGGAGNTPSTSPSQGNNGGLGADGGSTYRGAGGGGGAGAVGGNGGVSLGGAGGAGSNAHSSWLSTVGLGVSGYLAGGGGGGGLGTPYGAGGAGGGGTGGDTGNAVAGTANTGGGGGGVYSNYPAAAGGSGVVIIRYLA